MKKQAKYQKQATENNIVYFTILSMAYSHLQPTCTVMLNVCYGVADSNDGRNTFSKSFSGCFIV